MCLQMFLLLILLHHHIVLLLQFFFFFIRFLSIISKVSTATVSSYMQVITMCYKKVLKS